MARNLEHLELPRVRGEFPRRLHGGGRLPEREDKYKHGKYLIRKTGRVIQKHKIIKRPTGISPTLLFKLKIHPKADLNEDQLRLMNLSLVSKDPDKTIVVFSSDEALARFKRYISEYSGIIKKGHKYAFIAGIDDILPIEPIDRIGRLLKEEPIEVDEIAHLDVEMWYPVDREDCNKYIKELKDLSESLGGKLTDSYIGEYICLARCHINKEGLEAFLNVEYIKEVDRIPQPTFETSQLYSTNIDDIGDIPNVPEDAFGVLVIDSGVMGNHPLLRPALGDAQVFPDTLGENVKGGPEDRHGHGTSVCGIAVYKDLRKCIETKTFLPLVRLFSARVLDDNNNYDPDELIQNQIEKAIRYFIDNYPQCKVINISLGDENMYLRTGEKQLRLAAKIDEMAYKYKDHNILFVISSGNYRCNLQEGESRINNYPNYLLNEEAKILDPASSALGLTVGSLSTGNIPFRYAENSGVRSVAHENEFPSPFTRTGFGVDGMIKPELVDFGGDECFSRGMIITDQGVGIPTTSKNFLPPSSQLFRAPAGTSFAAPAVASMAAMLFNHFPSATSNMIRALLGDSALIPRDRPTLLQGNQYEENVLRTYGYGRADYERAAYSDQGEVLLIAEDEINLGNFHLYEIPSIPNEFLERKGERYICVTLAFDPPTRPTRGDSYLGLSMRYHLFRNIQIKRVEGIFRDWKRAPADSDEEELEDKLSQVDSFRKVALKPSGNIRSKGTLQKSMIKIKKRNWVYDGKPMILAVSCFRKWAPEEIEKQRYAVVVSIKHSDEDIRLYDRIRQHVRVVTRIRIRR